uniref:BZIP domain-containing protein n=1 Tax=Kalanchoe fedtschenkoi TaxID=63787 RepID=A0A7N0UHJ2_KALFE
MGNNEESKSCKSDKSTSPTPQDLIGMHVHPPSDWAAMQAFYGPRIPLPQYYNSAYPAGHPPHPYMWALPQAMMPSFAAHYAAIYSPGGVYAHPGVPIGSPKLGLGALSTLSATDALAATTLSIQTPGKTSGNTTGGSMDSESGDSGGSSCGSGVKTSGDEQSLIKRKCERPLDIEKTEKLEIQANSTVAVDTNLVPSMVAGIGVGPAPNGKLENVTALDMKTNHIVDSNLSVDAQQSGSKLSSETCFQSERHLKQERRKQSNRESARRSRLRKQAETEELAAKVDVLMAENVTLKSDINQLVKSSEKLKLENARMMEKLKNAKFEKAERVEPNDTDDNRNQTRSTENLLSRVNNSGSAVTQEEEGEMYSNNNSNPAKLHQLMDASPRADAVAAS